MTFKDIEQRITEQFQEMHELQFGEAENPIPHYA